VCIAFFYKTDIGELLPSRGFLSESRGTHPRLGITAYLFALSPLTEPGVVGLSPSTLSTLLAIPIPSSCYCHPKLGTSWGSLLGPISDETGFSDPTKERKKLWSGCVSIGVFFCWNGNLYTHSARVDFVCNLPWTSSPPLVAAVLIAPKGAESPSNHGSNRIAGLFSPLRCRLGPILLSLVIPLAH